MVVLSGLSDSYHSVPVQTITMLEVDQISCFTSTGDFIISVAILLVEALNLEAKVFTA